MASELYVETLKGLTSGANANKVIIPSGQTLDLGSGSINMPTGNYYLNQVSGVEKSGSDETLNVSHDQLAWQTALTNCSITLTPKSSNSVFIVYITLAWRAASITPGVSLGVEINGTRATPLSGDQALLHYYNGHRVTNTSTKHTESSGLGIYNAVGSSSHEFKIVPYVYNEGSSETVYFSQAGTQMYIMEFAQ